MRRASGPRVWAPGPSKKRSAASHCGVLSGPGIVAERPSAASLRRALWGPGIVAKKAVRAQRPGALSGPGTVARRPLLFLPPPSTSLPLPPPFSLLFPVPPRDCQKTVSLLKGPRVRPASGGRCRVPGPSENVPPSFLSRPPPPPSLPRPFPSPSSSSLLFVLSPGPPSSLLRLPLNLQPRWILNYRSILHPGSSIVPRSWTPDRN